MLIDIDLELFYLISFGILLVSNLFHSIELLVAPKKFLDLIFMNEKKKNPLFFWRMLQVSSLLSTLLTMVLLYYFQFQNITMLAFLVTSLVSFHSYRIRVSGKDGADQLRMIYMVYFCLGFLLPSHSREIVTLSFIGFQILLSYTTSGVAKLLSPFWRRGNVLAGIMSTYSFGYPGFGNILKKSPYVEKAASYTEMTGMLSVILCFFLPWQAPLIFALAFMFSFHFMTTALMGLNDFLLTFPAGYAGVIYLHHLYSGVIGQL